MAHYRLSELDLSTHVSLALEMLSSIPGGEWGRVIELAHTFGVSRQFLYQLRDRALASLTTSLASDQTGP